MELRDLLQDFLFANKRFHELPIFENRDREFIVNWIKDNNYDDWEIVEKNKSENRCGKMDRDEIKKELTGIILDYLRYWEGVSGKSTYTDEQMIEKFIGIYQNSFWFPKTISTEEKQPIDSPSMQTLKELRHLYVLLQEVMLIPVDSERRTVDVRLITRAIIQRLNLLQIG